jgi:hypothetical protein
VTLRAPRSAAVVSRRLASNPLSRIVRADRNLSDVAPDVSGTSLAWAPGQELPLAAWVKTAEGAELPGALDPSERAELARAPQGERRPENGIGTSCGKQPRILPGDEQVSRRFVSDHAREVPVKRLCALVGVPRSSFYEWKSRLLSNHLLDDAHLANAIFDINELHGAPAGHRASRAN